MKKIGFYLILIIALQNGCSDEEVNQGTEAPYFTLAQIKSSNPGGRSSLVS